MRRIVVICVLAASAAWAAAAETARTPLADAVAAAPPAAAPPAAPGNPPTVFAASEMHFTPTDVGARAGLMDEPSRTLANLEIHVTTLNPGQRSHAPHQHANEEIVVLHTGQLEVYVNGATKVVGPGSILVFLSNDWHGVRNVGAVPATYEVINVRPR